MAENEINTVHVLIRRFLYEIDDVIKDKDESHKWLVSFAKTLQFQDLCKTPNEYALTLLREAKEFCLSQRKKSQIKQVRKILADEGNANPTKEQIETRWAELYGNETTADAPTREDGEFKSDSGNAGNLESATSATIYGDAAISDEAEVSPKRESGVVEPTTISDFSGARESTRTDGHSLRVGNVARPPVRSRAKNSRCPNSREEFHAFVADNNLHEGLAEEWYAMHEAREWVDKDGNPIKDWRGALYNYCTKTEQKRRTA